VNFPLRNTVKPKGWMVNDDDYVIIDAGLLCIIRECPLWVESGPVFLKKAERIC